MAYKQFLSVPYEILTIEELTPTEKLVLGRIASFDEYFESAEHCAELFGVKKETITKAKRHLKELGYIEEVSNGGRGKTFIANPKWKINDQADEEDDGEEVDDDNVQESVSDTTSSDTMSRLNIRASVSEAKPKSKKFEKKYAKVLPAFIMGRAYLAGRRIPVTDIKALQDDFIAVLATFSEEYQDSDLLRIMTSYIEYLSSEEYEYQCRMNKFCPRISTQKDLYLKFAAIRDFKSSPERHYDPSKVLTN